MKMRANQRMFLVLSVCAWWTGCGQADPMSEVRKNENVGQSTSAVTGTRLQLNESQSGINGNTFDFAANTWPRTFSVVPIGDMVFEAGSFNSTDTKHRGIANLGPCNDLSEIPDWFTVAYRVGSVGEGFRSSVELQAGNCYAVRTHPLNANYGVVQVGSVSSSTVSLVYQYVTTWEKTAYLDARDSNQPVSFS